MKNFNELAREYGFKMIQIGKSEFADGIGATVGENYVRDQVFYTEQQFAAVAGIEIKFSAGNIQAKTAAAAEQQVIDQMKVSGIRFAHIRKNFQYAPGKFRIEVNYVK